MNIKQPYRLPELKEKISSGEYVAELLLQHAMLIIEEQEQKNAGFRHAIDDFNNQHITDSARIAKLESQLRAVTDDRDGWVKQCSDRIDDALEFAKESDARGEEIKAMKETLEKSMTPVAWYVTGTSRMQDKNDAKEEARRCGGTAEARPLYLHPYRKD